MFRNIAERQVSFGTPEGAADLWQVLGILASPCDKLDSWKMEDDFIPRRTLTNPKKTLKKLGKKP